LSRDQDPVPRHGRQPVNRAWPCLMYKRNEIERFERFVTDWQFREYAYHQ
jgi:hypothetical protein